MSLDLYLSEMSVSDRHGGGLTLQRVLEEDLEGIGLFVHVSRFATDLPVSSRFAPRCIDVPMATESDRLRKLVGYTQASWLSRGPQILSRHGHRVADRVNQALPRTAEGLRALICPQGAASLYAVEALAATRPIDYVTWVMDDHLIRWDGTGWRYPRDAESLFARHLQRARAAFVISPAMGELYRQRFGVDSQVLFGSANPSGAPQWEVTRDDDSVRLGYFGTVGRWQLDALSLLAGSLESANAELDIYTADGFLPQSLDRPRVKLRGRIPPAEIPRTMRSYDAVVLPASFEPELRNMTALNIATKMSECLVSGTVTLFIGPDYAAMARYLEARDAALLVTEAAGRAVADAIVTLRDPGRRRTLLQSARDLVESHLNTAAMHQVWLEGIARLP